MLTPKVYIPQIGILAGRKIIELDLRQGILVRRLKSIDITRHLQELKDIKYIYIQLRHGNLQDKTLKKLLEHIATLNKQLYIVTDSNYAEGVADILHVLSGIELKFANIQPQDIERICLLSAARDLQLDLSFEQMPDLSSFIPLFTQLNLSSINLYLPGLDNASNLPDNVRVFEAQQNYKR